MRTYYPLTNVTVLQPKLAVHQLQLPYLLLSRRMLLELIVVLKQDIVLEEYLVLKYLIGTLSMTLKLLQLVAGELSVESSSPQGSY